MRWAREGEEESWWTRFLGPAHIETPTSHFLQQRPPDCSDGGWCQFISLKIAVFFLLFLSCASVASSISFVYSLLPSQLLLLLLPLLLHLLLLLLLLLLLPPSLPPSPLPPSHTILANLTISSTETTPSLAPSPALTLPSPRAPAAATAATACTATGGANSA